MATPPGEELWPESVVATLYPRGDSLSDGYVRGNRIRLETTEQKAVDEKKQ